MSINNPPKDFSILFLDMNSFFASVEQQVQPTLRGIPIGVAPYTGGTGCVIAASKEAKGRGVKIGLVSEAKKLVPEIKILEARPALYMLYHKEIKKVIESFTPYFQPLSIDEFIIRLTPRDQNELSARKMALGLKKTIREKVGDSLTCSIGIGPSVFLAKMAGERRKPDGLTLVELENLKQFYAGLQLTDLTGINFRMEAQLKNLGIDSPLSLFNLEMGEMIRMLKHWGRLWYFRLRGFEVDDYVIKNKTIGHSAVLAPEFRTRSGALSVLRKLVFKAGYRLRRENYLAAGINISVNFMGSAGFHLSRKVATFSDNATFWAKTEELLKSCPWPGRPILVAVSAFNLTKKSGEQISIFKEVEKSRAISKALDQINDTFGAETIVPASVFLAKDSAPDRIPFGRPRYEIMH